MTYSPLFIRNYAKRFNLRVTAKGLKRRSKARFEAQRQALIMAAVDAKLAEKVDEQPWRDNLNMSVMCKDCKEIPPNIVEEYSSGDMVCGSCGLILGDRVVDTRSEWRTFSNDDQNNDDPSRVGDGANPLLNGSQLQTSISFGDGGARARDLHRTQNKSTHDKATKGLLAAYKEIGGLCDGWQLPKNATDTAKHLYKMVNDAGAFRGKSESALIAGCIFIACRQCKVSRSFREIFDLTKVSKKEVGRIFKALEIFFAEANKTKKDAVTKAGGVVNSQENYISTSSTKAAELCNRFCSSLGLEFRISAVSEQLAEKMSSVGALAGRSPLSAAAACIYFVSHLLKQPRTAKEISKVAGVSDGTIRTSYKLLEAQKDVLVDEEWLKDGKGDMSLLPKV